MHNDDDEKKIFIKTWAGKNFSLKVIGNEVDKPMNINFKKYAKRKLENTDN